MPPVTGPQQVVHARPGPTQAVQQPEQPERGSEPQPVTLKVMTEPAGAVVVIDGKPHGATPTELPLVPDAPPVTLALKLDGYQPQVLRGRYPPGTRPRSR